MTPWQAAVAKIEQAMEKNPGSLYVSVYVSRRQAEALVRKLTKPHLYPDVKRGGS